MITDHWEMNRVCIRLWSLVLVLTEELGKEKSIYYASVAIFSKTSLSPTVPIIIYPDTAVTQTRCHSKVKITLFS